MQHQSQDGDQTKYLPPPPPTTYQSVKLSAEHVWKDVVSEGENLMKQSVPLAKDLGVVAKGAAVVAKDFVDHAISNWMTSAADSRAMSHDLDARTTHTVTAQRSSKEPATPAQYMSSEPPTYSLQPSTSPTPEQDEPSLSDSETTVIANALIDEELTTADVETEEVKAFLAAFRKAKAMKMEDIPLGEPVFEDPEELEELLPRGEWGRRYVDFAEIGLTQCGTAYPKV